MELHHQLLPRLAGEALLLGQGAVALSAQKEKMVAGVGFEPTTFGL